MALFGNKKTKNDSVEKKEEPVKDAVSMKDLYAPTAKKVSSKSGSKKDLASYPHAHSVLIKPLVTEKATNLSAKNQYVFMVSPGANKVEVAKAITAVYQVKPVSVNLINMKGKKVTRGRIRGARKDWKKAIVTLAAGTTIQVYEGV